MASRILAAIDIGSMEHKLVVATVGKDIEVLHSEAVGVALALDLQRSGSDGSLSPAIVEESRSVRRRFRETANHFGAVQTAGVATAVFRRASNGREALGEGIRLIDQQAEGRLGYYTAVACARRSGVSSELLSWDSGGGSFQIASSDSVYEGAIGSGDANRLLRDSPDALLERLQDLIAPSPSWLQDKLRQFPVIAFGHTTSLFRLAADVAGTPDLTLDDVRNAYDKVVKDDDRPTTLRAAALSSAKTVSPHDPFQDAPYPEIDLVVPKLALLLAVMTKLDIQKIHYEYANGSCLGIFLFDDLWTA